MDENLEKNRVNTLGEVMKYMGIVMALLYVAGGIAVLTAPNSLFNIPSTYALPFGSMLIVYGLFRAYRMYRNVLKR